MSTHAQEVSSGERFSFGQNWQQFLKRLNEKRILEAEKSLKQMLGVETLAGKTFLDVGSGSGLFSLAAMRLGAAKVHSFDYDPQSVACTRELQRRFFPDASHWTIAEGSVLDDALIDALGQWDVVYSWGVLHHTGNMWRALSNVQRLCKPNGGLLFIAIYNDQGWTSRVWTLVKRSYNRMPDRYKFLILGPSFVRLWGPTLLRDFVQGKPLCTWRAYIADRGMSPWRDVVDWVGGYPFEVAKPEEIFAFYRQHGFTLCTLRTCGGGLGCNEFVFQSTQHG